MYKKRTKRKVIWSFSIILILTIITIIVFSFNKSMVKSSITAKQLSTNDTAKSINTEYVLNADQLIANKTDTTSIGKNTQYLQSLVDTASNSGGGIVHIPAGTFYFATSGKSENGAQDYVIHCKNNVTIEGAGTNTILKPYGTTDKGLDMFYYNEYSDSNYKNPEYLVNANFKDFVIDGSDANCVTYTTAGKGFMINLYKNCNWENVTVKYTDGTGFGMDCPIDSTIVNCVAIGCGKAASTTQNGAAGFGIGTGYSRDENILIENCVSTDNKKYGIFFEHQGRFNQELYTDTSATGFVVRNCRASGNLYDFGGEYANYVIYENCTSTSDRTSSSYIHFDNNSRFTNIINCNTQLKFSDVTDQSEYYYKPVYWALNNGITDGVTKTKFGVDSQMKRGQVIVALWRMEGRKGIHFLDRNGNSIFDDVPYDSEYAAALEWASARGVDITSSSGLFYPDEGCTRADFITFLWKYAGKPSVQIDISFSDIPSGSEAEKAVNWAIDKGITNGIEGIFQADHICEREDVMTFLYRYVQATGIKFDITYKLLGGKMDKTDISSYTSGSSNFTLRTPTKEGYTFTGWTGSNGSSPQSTVSVSTQNRGNLVYTAHWQPNTYTIKFDSNGGTGNMSDLKLKYDELNALTNNKFTKNGFKFVGWNTMANGSGESFTNMQRILNLTANDSDTITLYAQWEKTDGYDTIFKVEHYKENVDGGYKLEETDTYEAISGTEATPDRKLYKGFTAPAAQTVTVAEDGSTLVKYYYTRNSYKLTINKGTGIASVTGDGTYKFDQSVNVSAITKAGYENPIWKLNGNTVNNTFLMPAGDIQLDVSAQAVKYNITYNLDGGVMASNPSEYTIEDEITLKAPLKPGYKFIGWTGSNGTTPQKDVTISKGTTGDKTYTANWEVNSDVDMEVVIYYSITTPTEENVTVFIKSNVPINIPEGWQRGEDEYTITKVYDQNVNEIITITSTNGLSIQANVRINNIDKTQLNVKVSYEYISASNKVIVTITSNKELQNIGGWVTNDNKIFTKTYTENTEESIIVKDIEENETTVQIKVNQIKDNPDENPDDSEEDQNNPGGNTNNPGEDSNNPNEDSNNSGENSGNANNSSSNTGNSSNNNSNGNTNHLINTEKAKNNTTANSKIPQTGNNISFIIISITAVAIIGIIAFIKFKKYGDIK